MFVAEVAKVAAGAKVLRGTTLTTRRVFPKGKWMMVVVAFALVALAVVIGASQAPNAEGYYSVESKDFQGATQATAALSGVSEAEGAPQMSEQEAQDAYEKLPLSFAPMRARSPTMRYATMPRVQATACSSRMRGLRSP
jgi:hypothetical protein